MADVTQKQKKLEFKENFNKMTESDEGMAAYISTFSDQTNAENPLASGGGENLGSIENELAALSAMNEISSLPNVDFDIKRAVHYKKIFSGSGTYG